MEYQVNVIRSAKRKRTITFEVHGDVLVIRCPVRTTDEEIRSLVDKKRSWIEQALEKMQSVLDSELHSNGAQPILYQGEQLEVIRKHIDVAGIRVQQSGLGELSVSSHVTLTDDEVHALVTSWLKRQANHQIPIRVANYAERLGYRYNRVQVKEQKRRWGSCSSQRNLNFNWRLIQAPTWVLDYVIVHELCHLREMNHSDRFWSLVKQAYPNYEEAKQWLREHGHRLY